MTRTNQEICRARAAQLPEGGGRGRGAGGGGREEGRARVGIMRAREAHPEENSAETPTFR